MMDFVVVAVEGLGELVMMDIICRFWMGVFEKNGVEGI
jgi:hypothetical protein